MVRRHAQTSMTVLVVDNLQWADPALRDQLGVIVRTLSDLPFLLVTTQRPDGGHVWPPPVERPLVVQIPLGPLSRDDADDARVRHPRPRRQRATPRRSSPTSSPAAAGTRCSSSSWPAWPPTCDGDDLPGSLRALIAARIDQLPAPQRAIVDNASVLGTADSIGSLVPLRPGDGPGVPPARPRRAGRRRAARRRRLVVALPQRGRPRGRLPDADEARPGPAPRRRRRRDGRARGLDRRRRPPRRDGRRAARRARHRRRREAVDHRPTPCRR